MGIPAGSRCVQIEVRPHLRSVEVSAVGSRYGRWNGQSDRNGLGKILCFRRLASCRHDTTRRKSEPINSASRSLPRVDVAVFVAAMSRYADCQAHPERAHRVNVLAPAALAARLAEAGTLSILLSTSAVFDGTQPRAPAHTPTNPISLYGKLKSAAETLFLKLGAKGSVVRLTKVLTTTSPLLVDWIGALKAGRPVEAFEDLLLAPIGLADVRAAVLAATQTGGIVQASGLRDITYVDIANHIAHRLGCTSHLIRAVRSTERGIPASDRPENASLDATLLSTVAIWQPPDPFELIDRLYFGSPDQPALRGI
jgi:dTDP-4-dehydrorhamnose reductase